MTPDPQEAPRPSAFSRRRLLGAAGAGALAVGAAGVGGWAYGHESEEPPHGVDQVRYPFEGTHQAGITTPAQDRLHFAAFDVRTESRAELIDLLKKWTVAARQMTAGRVGGRFAAHAVRRPAERHRRGHRPQRSRA